jgi:hypothetical protein
MHWKKEQWLGNGLKETLDHLHIPFVGAAVKGGLDFVAWKERFHGYRNASKFITLLTDPAAVAEATARKLVFFRERMLQHISNRKKGKYEAAYSKFKDAKARFFVDAADTEVKRQAEEDCKRMINSLHSEDAKRPLNELEIPLIQASNTLVAFATYDAAPGGITTYRRPTGDRVAEAGEAIRTDEEVEEQNTRQYGGEEKQEEEEEETKEDVGGMSGAVPAAPTALGVSTSSLQQLPITWSADQVADWMGGIGEAYAEYTDAFIKNGINSEELLRHDFGKDELEELGVTSIMHQKRILKEIQKLKQQVHERKQQHTGSASLSSAGQAAGSRLSVVEGEGDKQMR